jgi:signal transduction histidine kinase
VIFITGNEKTTKEFELARILKLINLLNSIVRHEANNEICTISGYAGMLRDETFMKKEGDVNKFLDVIISSCKNMEELYKFSKEYEGISHGNSWQSLSEISSCSRKFFGKIKITFNNERGEIKIYASVFIPKVLENLVDNTLRHGNATEIRIRSFISTKEELTLVYEDNGVGILEKDKERIFDKGFGKNTGLGLFLAREILDITGIKIRENGEPGKGVRFEIIIPKDHYKITI